MIEKDVLKKLNDEGLSNKEIGKKLNLSRATIARYKQYYGIKTKYCEIKHVTITCVYCDKKFDSVLSEKRKFCSSKCSGKHGSIGRKLSEETKNKIRKSLTKGRKIKKRYCKKCGNILNKPRIIICNKCKSNYYNYYRRECDFDFNIYDFKKEFDIYLIEKYGKYSPSNKRNNLNGISMDHMYSVKMGFDNNINPYIIKHPANCKLMKHNENNSKKTNSSITYDELLKRIEEWNKKYGKMV